MLTRIEFLSKNFYGIPSTEYLKALFIRDFTAPAKDCLGSLRGFDSFKTGRVVFITLVKQERDLLEIA